MVNIVNVKKAIITERVRKDNPYHDRYGKFCSAQNAVTTVGTGDGSFVNLDKIDSLSQKDKTEIKKYIQKIAKEVSSVDERLGITEEKAIEIMDKECCGVTSEKWKIEKLAELEKEMIVGRALNEYCENNLGVKKKLYGDIDTELFLDFVDGASWAREKLGATSLLKQVGSESPLDDLGSDAIAATSLHDDGSCNLVVSNTRYEKGSDFFDTYDSGSFHPKNMSSQQIGAHEYVHVFERELTRRAYGEDEIQDMFSRSMVSNYIIKDASSRIGKPISYAVGEVSDYAKTNMSEAFAECIADVYSNGDGAAELSKQVFKIATEEADDVCRYLESTVATNQRKFHSKNT